MSYTLPDGTWMCCDNPLSGASPDADDVSTCMNCGAQYTFADDGRLVILFTDFQPGWEKRRRHNWATT